MDNLDEIIASDDAVRAFLRAQTSHCADDIKFGEVICYSAHRYAIYSSDLLKLICMLQSEYSNGQRIWEGKSLHCGRWVFASYVDILPI